MRALRESLEAPDPGHDDLFGASLILLEEGPPQLQSVPFLTACELQPAFVNAVVEGMIAQEAPEDLGELHQVELLGIVDKRFLERGCFCFSQVSRTRPLPRFRT